MTPQQAWALAYGAPAASTYSAPATTNYGNLSAGIGQDVLARMAGTRMWDPSGGDGSTGSWGWETGNPIYGSDPNGNPLAPTYQPSTLAYHPQGQGVGEQYPTFDPQTGEFKGYQTGSKVQSYASGVLSVAGAGLGMGAAFGGAGAGGYAAGGYAGGGGAGAAAGGAAGGASGAAGGAGVTGFGDAGTMYAGSDAAAAGSLGGGASIPYGAGVAGAAGAAGGGGAGAGGTGAAGGAGGGASTAGGSGLGSIMNPDGSINWAGLGTAALGAFAGSKPNTASQSSSHTMDPRMDSLFYGGLAPATAATLGSTMPAAQTAGNQMMQVGSGLLGQTAPTTATNPYLKSIADDMQLRTKELLDENNLAIQGDAVASGGLGGARQGVAQGIGAGKAADYLQGNVANLYGTAYTGDQNRLLQQQTLGAGLVSQGLDTQFQPLKSTASIYNPFTGFGSTSTTASQGGGLLGAAGGALGAAQLGKNMGWW